MSNCLENREQSIEVTARYAWYGPIKIVLDLIAALLLLVPCLPIIILAAIGVKLTSRGPAFYSQTRVGLNGRKFRIYKLRSMRQDAEAQTGAVWSQTNDPRITPLGRWLRDLHIDEFPQLLNVLLLQMSLVGPRPERPEFVNSLEWEVQDYRQRLKVRPGITGIAQLNLPPDSDLDSVREKVIHDMYYVRYSNPWLDLKIMFYTGWMLVKSILSPLLRGFALPDKDEVTGEVAKLKQSRSQLPEHLNATPELRATTRVVSS